MQLSEVTDMQFLLPFVSVLGFGGLLGYGAAVFLKSVTRMVGCVIGIVFILMQLLAYYGFAEWQWEAIGQAADPAATAARSGFSVLWRIMTYNLPFTGGFAGGFWYGWKH
jgi:uncharacterized membrane protein (Fun14 family)